MMLNSRASVPLTEALPWPSPPPSDGRCFVVCDSIETDGRFLLHTLASQVLSASHAVCWVACGPWTDRLIATAMKKMGCETAAAYLRSSTSDNDNNRPLHIRSVPVELATRLEEGSDPAEFDAELYIKELYHSIRSWTSSGSSNGDWIILDDVSALATLVGERLTYCFILSLRALANRTKTFSLMIRCSHDFDLESLKERDTTSVRAGGSRQVDWVGAGGRGASFGTQEDIPWERALTRTGRRDCQCGATCKWTISGSTRPFSLCHFRPRMGQTRRNTAAVTSCSVHSNMDTTGYELLLPRHVCVCHSIERA